MTSPLTLEAVEKAAKRIKDYVHQTPVMTSRMINERVGGGVEVFFKCEHLQRTGAFKVRGAMNAILCLKEAGPVKGVVTHSSGNHGQAIALAATAAGVPSVVVVPKTAPAVKPAAIRGYGAEVILCEPTPQSRVATCQEVADSRGYSVIGSSDNYDVMAGQGTIGLELMSQVPNLDAVLVPISGGGMGAGISTTVKTLSPATKVFMVEPLGKELEPCLRAKERLWQGPNKFLDTLADGLVLQQTGQLTFPILCEHAEAQVLTVNNEDIVAGMKLVYSYLKQVVEPAAGSGPGALLKHVLPADCKRIGVVLCGGNVNIDKLPW